MAQPREPRLRRDVQRWPRLHCALRLLLYGLFGCLWWGRAKFPQPRQRVSLLLDWGNDPITLELTQIVSARHQRHVKRDADRLAGTARMRLDVAFD